LRVSPFTFHPAADVLTDGLWEVVATPGEAFFNGTQVAFEVDYDREEKIEKVVTLQK